MPKCANCYKFFPPEYLITKGDGGRVCVFCEVGKDEVTAQNGTVEKKIKKDEVVEEYRRALKELSERPNIKKLLNKE